MRFKFYWGHSFKVEQAPALNKKNKKEYLDSTLTQGINGRYANWIKQAVCKTVAFGRCRFKSYPADSI